MQVTTVRVSFLRARPPAQFEKAEPAVEFMATLDDNDDHRLAARSLMIDAADVVYAGLGYKIPEKIAQMLFDDSTPSELDVVVETNEAEIIAGNAADETPKKRGRPKGSRNTLPKKGTKADDLAVAMAKLAPSGQSDDDIPGDDIPDDIPEDKPLNISTGEDRIDPEDDIPGDEPKTMVDDSEFTGADLQNMLLELIEGTPRQLSVPNAKQMLAYFKVARAKDLTNEQALEGKGMIEQMVAVSAEQR